MVNKSKRTNILSSTSSLPSLEENQKNYKVIINGKVIYDNLNHDTIKKIFNFIYDSTLLKERGTKIRISPAFGIQLTLDYKVKPDIKNPKFNPCVFNSNLNIFIEKYNPPKDIEVKEFENEYDKSEKNLTFEQEQIKGLNFPKTSNPNGFIESLNKVIRD
ncbi:MAG: hypothetical protein QW727_02640 [Candidatus Pacearchaeota archaeon]